MAKDNDKNDEEKAIEKKIDTLLNENMAELRQLSLPSLVEGEFGWITKTPTADGEIEVVMATYIKRPTENLVDRIIMREIKRKLSREPRKERAKELLIEENSKYESGRYRKILPLRIQDFLHYITGLKTESAEDMQHFHSESTNTIRFNDRASINYNTRCLIKYFPAIIPPRSIEQIYDPGDLEFIEHTQPAESLEDLAGMSYETTDGQQVPVASTADNTGKKKNLTVYEEMNERKMEKEKREAEKKRRKEEERQRKQMEGGIKQDNKDMIFNYSLIILGQASEDSFNALKNQVLTQIESRAEIFLDRKRYSYDCPDSTKTRIQHISRINDPYAFFAEEITKDMAKDQVILTPQKKLEKLEKGFLEDYQYGNPEVRDQIKTRGMKKFYDIIINCIVQKGLDYNILGGDVSMPIIAWSKDRSEWFYVSLGQWYPTLKDEAVDWRWVNRPNEYLASLKAKEKSGGIFGQLAKHFLRKEDSEEVYFGSQIIAVKSRDEDAIANVLAGQYSLLSAQRIFKAAV